MNKELELIKSNHLHGFPVDEQELNNAYATVDKKLKILEFIRRTLFVEPREYHLSDGTSEYVLKYDVYSRSITKEEFDLLSELGDF